MQRLTSLAALLSAATISSAGSSFNVATDCPLNPSKHGTAPAAVSEVHAPFARALQVEAPDVVVESRSTEAVVREPYLWEKVRARANNWLLAGSGKRVMRWVTKGVPAYFNALGPPKPFNMGVCCQNLSVDGE